MCKECGQQGKKDYALVLASDMPLKNHSQEQYLAVLLVGCLLMISYLRIATTLRFNSSVRVFKQYVTHRVMCNCALIEQTNINDMRSRVMYGCAFLFFLGQVKSLSF